jgi:hypothetical protein
MKTTKARNIGAAVHSGIGNLLLNIGKGVAATGVAIKDVVVGVAVGVPKTAPDSETIVRKAAKKARR